jgi:hypothetical protein
VVERPTFTGCRLVRSPVPMPSVATRKEEVENCGLTTPSELPQSRQRVETIRAATYPDETSHDCRRERSQIAVAEYGVPWLARVRKGTARTRRFHGGPQRCRAPGRSGLRSDLERAPVRGHSIETELVALDVLHHEARLVGSVSRQ